MGCKTLYLPTHPFFTRPGTMKKPGTLSIKEVATAEALEQTWAARLLSFQKHIPDHKSNPTHDESFVYDQPLRSAETWTQGP